MFDQITQSFALGSWDFLALGFLILVTIAYALLFVSRGKVMPLLVASALAFLLVDFAPFSVFAEFPGQLIGFAVIFLVILFILSRVLLQSPVGSETFGLILSFLLALSQTGFLLSILTSLLPGEVVRELGSLTATVLVGSSAIFYWAMVSVLLLLLVGRRANEEVG